MLRGLPAFRGGASLATWAARIADHVVIDRRRRQAARPGDEAGPPPEGDVDALADAAAPRPEDEHEEGVSVACLRGAMATLSESYRQVFELHELAGLENTEIAELLALPLSTVKTRVHRTRRRLRMACEAGCDVFGGRCGGIACAPREPRERRPRARPARAPPSGRLTPPRRMLPARGSPARGAARRSPMQARP